MKNLIFKLIVFSAISCSALTLFTPTVSAHRSGCHAQHSCPSDSGSYVCGDTGNFSQCPTGSAPAPAPAPAPKKSTPKTPTKAKAAAPKPRVPIITTSTVTSDEAIPFSNTDQPTNTEYTGYKNVIVQGSNGVKRNYFEVTTTDGSETARKLTKSEIISAPVNSTTLIGARGLPESKITAVKETRNKGKFDVYGTYKTGKKIGLLVDGKQVKTMTVGTDGKFMFKQIKLSSKYALLAIQLIDNKTTKKVSETTITNTTNANLATDYDRIHNTNNTYKVIKVVDGDTIKIAMNGKTETIRLIGMDTPETVDRRKTVQCFGKEASARAKSTLLGKTVKLEADPSQGNRDKYQRLLRYVYLQDGSMFNKTMIADGYAHEYTYRIPYKYMADFKAAEDSARAGNKGLWAPTTCAGVTK